MYTVFYRLRTTLARAASHLCIMTVFCGTCAADMPQIGDFPPRWKQRSIDDSVVEFPKIAGGQPAVLLFWASWCPYCEELMPRLDRLKNEYPDLDIFAVNFAQSGNLPPDRHPMSRLSFVHVFGGDGIAAKYGVNSIPALFLINEGRVAYRLDYPPKSHPSQSASLGKSEKIGLLGEWWEDRLRGVFDSVYR